MCAVVVSQFYAQAAGALAGWHGTDRWRSAGRNAPHGAGAKSQAETSSARVGGRPSRELAYEDWSLRLCDVTLTVSFTCALSAATRRRSAQPQLAPTAARKAGARRRKASAQEPQTMHRSGTSSSGGSQRGGPVSDYKGLHARGSTCRGWLRRRMVLDITAQSQLQI